MLISDGEQGGNEKPVRNSPSVCGERFRNAADFADSTRIETATSGRGDGNESEGGRPSLRRTAHLPAVSRPRHPVDLAVAFDLSSYDDVSANGGAMRERLAEGEHALRRPLAGARRRALQHLDRRRLAAVALGQARLVVRIGESESGGDGPDHAVLAT